MPEWLQEIKTKIKNRGRRPRFFISRSLFPVITRARFVFYLNKCQWKPTSFNCFHVSFLSDSTCLSTPTPRQTLRVELSRSRFEASQELLCFHFQVSNAKLSFLEHWSAVYRPVDTQYNPWPFPFLCSFGHHCTFFSCWFLQFSFQSLPSTREVVFVCELVRHGKW